MDESKLEKAVTAAATQDGGRKSEEKRKKPRIGLPILVEGRYDKIKLDSLFEADVIEVGGFSVFNRADRVAFFRRLAERGGVIVLTDSDGGGRQIRSYLSECLPKEAVRHLYIPAVAGKEKRKRTAGKAGLLGVEGTDAETLRRLFAPFIGDGDGGASENATENATENTAEKATENAAENAAENTEISKENVARSKRVGRLTLTKADLFADGLCGVADAVARRERVLRALGLPPDLTPQAMLDALNLLVSPEEYAAALQNALEESL